MRLVLRGQRQYGLWEQSIDQTLDFDLDFAPVLQELFRSENIGGPYIGFLRAPTKITLNSSVKIFAA